MAEKKLLYKRILLKISGEALKGKQEHGYDSEAVGQVVARIREALGLGVEIALVVGAGNIWRGLAGSKTGMDRVTADHMGMLATAMNALCLKDAFTAAGVPCSVHSAVAMEPFAKKFDRERALAELSEGKLVIFACGTGSPYFTTDTGSSLRGIEIEADVMLKGTRVDGVYTADPEKDPTATKFHDITYKEVLSRGLKVMDLTAICMCQDNNLPIYVFNMDQVGNLKRVIDGEEIGTLVHN